MGSVVEILLWVWIALESGVNSDSLPEITNRRFIDECVKAHNEARSSVNPPASDMLYMVSKMGRQNNVNSRWERTNITTFAVMFTKKNILPLDKVIILLVLLIFEDTAARLEIVGCRGDHPGNQC